jgi:GNAT superfamily N-acetyltransferase
VSPPGGQGQGEIRPYRPDDEAAVRRIAVDTAFFGQPVEAYLDDGGLFYDFFYAYYTRYEADHGWIAELEGQTVGFLMGCPDTRRKAVAWARDELPRLAIRLLSGKYRLGGKTWRYLLSQAGAAARQELALVDLQAYPAHLHVNVAADRRGLGLGRRLLAAYLEQLRREGSPGVHLRTTSLNRTACRLYEQAGFRLLAAHPTRAWQRLVTIPVENRLYGLRLNP